MTKQVQVISNFHGNQLEPARDQVIESGTLLELDDERAAKFERSGWVKVLGETQETEAAPAETPSEPEPEAATPAAEPAATSMPEPAAATEDDDDPEREPEAGDEEG